MDDEPIRGELFGIENFEKFALELAAAQRVTPRVRRRGRLLAGLEHNARALLHSYGEIASAIRDERAISPAGEWLVDNFHIVEDQLREIREDLPPSFYRQLPVLSDGPLRGYPRAYGLAWEYVAHSDSRVDLEQLRAFVLAFQRVQALTIGELWALPIALRLLLVENLRRLSDRMVERRAARDEADELADELLGVSGRPRPVDEAIGNLDDQRLSTAFIVRLLQRLRDSDPARTPAIAALHARLAAQPTPIEELVAAEHQRQVATHVTVRNVITSMRLLSSADWRAFFDDVSLVEAELRKETRVAEMDFPTRDLYRHAVEELARGSKFSEVDVARRAVERCHADARAAASDAERELFTDPGHCLIGDARREFERELGFRSPVRQRLVHMYLAAGAGGYVAAICIVAALLIAVPLVWTAREGAHGWVLALLAAAAAIPALGLAIALVNRHVPVVVKPRQLPRLELAQGVPVELRTLVVVPMMLSSHEQVLEQVARLEVHYLANPEVDLRFALLSDYLDADSESMPGDEQLFAAALGAITALNQVHGSLPDGSARFLLLHRTRKWNAGEGRWMGWERKRGKLRELDRLLRGASDTSFVARSDMAAQVPTNVRFVITLDADTRLPMGAARRLIGALAHPLNRPRFDERTRRVVAGYGVLQPRITATLPDDEQGTLFQRVFAGAQGLDPYAFAVSDIHQDLFGAGIYAGKGIYDVDAFERALEDRVPENSLLSHDLFEGLFARAGLVTDVEFFDEYPAHYSAAAARAERWARGDWQLLPWLRRRIFDGIREPVANPIPAIGRIQILDNLRRSLAAPASLALLFAAWLAPNASPTSWTVFVAAVWAAPSLLELLPLLVPRRAGVGKRSFARRIGEDFALASAQIGLGLMFLPHQAWLCTQAIARALARYRTRKRRLEWIPAAATSARSTLALASFVRLMSAGPVCAAIAAVAARPPSLECALPFACAWLVSPLVARWVSLPPRERRRASLRPRQVELLRLTARRTWRFFEECVGADDHFLPPDNVQEDPVRTVARRTSPTNIGVYLLSIVGARDFGWIGSVEMLERIEATLSTLDRLELFHGHLYNWYSTADLQPLAPKYVSTVDSGNLAAHLLTLEHACRELVEPHTADGRALAGMRDALTLARPHLEEWLRESRDGSVTKEQLAQALAELAAAVGAPASGAWADNLREIARGAALLVDIAHAVDADRSDAGVSECLAWVRAVRACATSHLRDLDAQPATRASRVAERARALALAMDFRFLFDKSRKLFAIGYRPDGGRQDPNCYDLLASEARLTSLLAIARGDVPVEHWFRLGRPLLPLGRGVALASWSGSMFEYLMPELVLRTPPHSLLAQTARLVVAEQMRYGHSRGVPWGISESAFSGRDLGLTYQYKSLGVPGLGLRRGRSEDLVIAPYATALAAMVDAPAAASNFLRLTREGARGALGFYEAVDYTTSRLQANQRRVVVRSYMAHHQGMTIVALDNVLHAGVMRARFHAEPLVQAAELLLQERTPHGFAVTRARTRTIDRQVHVRDHLHPVLRGFASPHDVTPRTHLLSNGKYVVMMTNAGSGYSRCGDLAVTRWREDPTRDDWGSYVFIADVERHKIWSAGFHPSAAEADSYEAAYYEDRVEIRRTDGVLATTLEVVVSAEDDAEVRRVSITNLGLSERELELTSYAEIVLATPDADNAHPAFSKLFVQTEFVPGVDALLATRRPRSPEETCVWAAHVMALQGTPSGALQYDTDRARFLGRGRDLCNAVCVRDGRPLSNTVGPVLDPIFSLRRRVRLPPGATARVVFSTLVAPTRDAALALVDRYRQPAIFERTADLAWIQAQVQLRHLGVDAEEAHLFQRVATRVLYSDPTLRAPRELLRANTRGASGLWPHGLSGDVPIVVARIDHPEDIDLVRQLLRAHEYWRMKRTPVDLVILNEQAHSYASDLQMQLESLVRMRALAPQRDGQSASGGVFVLHAERIPPSDRDLLLSAARVVANARDGSLTDLVVRPLAPPPPAAAPYVERRAGFGGALAPPRLELEFFNGLGGFSDGGREYVVVLGERQWTPAPWINVVAQAGFGFQVSESGSGFTWAGNSRENKLTAWSNDPVSDPPGEVLYVRDEQSDEVWTPTALPIREHAPYIARHGAGYSRFEHESHGIALQLTQFVPLADPLKISRLRVENRSRRRRVLSVTAYFEWVLGPTREQGARYTVTSLEPATKAILARNPWNEEWSTQVAFADLGGRQGAWTADRTEFLGRNGSPERPASLASGVSLSGKTGAGLDPCAALQTRIELEPGESAEVLALLGATDSADAARALIERYRAADLDACLDSVRAQWDDVLGALEVSTPDRSFDVLVNRWLLYQTLACRVWARSAFYQAGGAFGFRDQLQDVMALCVARREEARAQIVRCAGRQFQAGDVQHWWHAPSGRGVRTRISDDALWLPYATLHYCEATGDRGVLDETVPFLEGPELPPERDDIYFTPTVAQLSASVFEHCARVIDHSLTRGAHGLPLMGSGDWNDGMNRVGRAGRGESVWLGWFLHTILWEFAQIAEQRGEVERAVRWRAHQSELATALDRDAWDGDWYRRAYFDDGTPLGSTANPECRIDSIAQTWAVISGAADPARGARAMAAVEQHLVRRGDGLVLLFTPPFDRSALEPGYVKGYLPGVRENGGQYTHAAVWTVIAFAALGQGDKAGELFAILNPINQASSRAGMHRYKVEPYVMAADIYSQHPHVGRGGWTWYTGAAGWMYRAGVEWILGFRLRGKVLHIDPCIPRNWPRFEVKFRYHSALYLLHVENPHGVTRGVSSITVDGTARPPVPREVELVSDGAQHHIDVVIG
jgi:cyclic beta-1,2-glucan synthetase